MFSVARVVRAGAADAVPKAYIKPGLVGVVKPRPKDGSLYGDAAAYLKYSHYGPGSNYAVRQRYPTLIKHATDSCMGDFTYNKMLRDAIADSPAYAYNWSAWGALAVAVLMTYRHLLFNPDVTFRKQEVKLPFPDRHRQFQYCLPFYHHRLRNWMNKFMWEYSQNEPDYKDISYSGLRPDRVQSHRLPYYWSCFHLVSFRYRILDPLYTSVTHDATAKLYHDIGYKKSPHLFPDVEEE